MLTNEEQKGLYKCICVPRKYKHKFKKRMIYFVTFYGDEVDVETSPAYSIVMKKKYFFDYFSFLGKEKDENE